jgi:hypothetical protein
MNWYQAALQEIATYGDLHQLIPTEERNRRGEAALDAFHHIFTKLVARLHIRDTWPEPHCHINVFETGIIERSTKLQGDFTLGVSLEGWFLEASIVGPRFIRQMSDEYWEHIQRLSTLGKARLKDYGRPSLWDNSPEVRKLTQHKASLVFSIARDYTILASRPEGCSSLGAIRVDHPLNSDEQTVTAFFKETLESLYRSNAMLKRVEKIERRRITTIVQRQIQAETEKLP